MPANQYQFLTQWHVAAPQELLYEILKEGKDYPRWWPDVYLEAKFTPSGRADHVGDRVEFFTKGWLPYRLHWTAEVVRHQQPEFIEITATGDFVGRGIWTFEQDGDFVNIVYDWKIQAEKPLLRRLSWLLKPIFSANHHWAMRKGEESLRLELARRRARTPEELARVPAPPQPTWVIRKASNPLKSRA